MAGGAAKGQGRVIQEVRRLVDTWRGFELGTAAEPYPIESPSYKPTIEGEQELSATSHTLLHHWFRREPHVIGPADHQTLFKYWPHQRRLVESFIYLYEVRGIRRTEELYALAGVEPLGPQRDPWTKLGGQLATGSGKTKMMSLIIAWAYLNALCEKESTLGFGRHSIVIAPGLFVRDRLLQDFAPPDGRTPVFWADPVIPVELKNLWNLKVYSPANCPRRLDLNEGALVVTNYHQLLRTSESADAIQAGQSTLELLFSGEEPKKLEQIGASLVDSFSASRGLLVLNDEAHHVWDETGHAKFEQKAKEKAKLSNSDGRTAMAWIRSIRQINGSESKEGKVALQVDLSATLFEEQGAVQKKRKTVFRQADLFRHTTVTYGLPEAITDAIVKRPVLERVEVLSKQTGQPEPLVREGSANAWEKYRNLLSTGIARWRKVRDQLRDEGDPRKPILFVLCNDQNDAKEVANYLAYGEAVREDLSHRAPIGFLDPETKETLFVETDEDGGRHSTVIQIHIGKKEETNESEWEKVRQAVNMIDQGEMRDPNGAVDAQGHPVMLPNPYNVVVSVMMLKEGWDVRNVKVIVPLRPCDSRTLTEQTLGRGLRKMHPAELDDEGAAQTTPEELYVIEHPSFRTVIEHIRDLVEEKGSDEIDHAREYVPILQATDLDARQAADVRLVRFGGMHQAHADWRSNFDTSTLPPLTPRVPWLESLPESEIRTYLKKALEAGEKEGLSFSISANPTYRDFMQVLGVAYARPILREMRSGFQHEPAVRGVVQEFLERKTFDLPAGLPLSLDSMIGDEHAEITLGNLTRPEVMEPVRKALIPRLHSAMTMDRSTPLALLPERRASEIENYQATKKNVLRNLKKTVFQSAAFDSADEKRVAILLESAQDVVGWVYNHRSGVGYSIPYDWQGYTAQYYPDFIARAEFEGTPHNFIIEVKGRIDDRDRAKARRGQRYSELLTEHDREPWHYLLLLENKSEGRRDISDWQDASSKKLVHVLRRHEGLPLYPQHGGSQPPPSLTYSVRPEPKAVDKFETRLPVYDLATVANVSSESDMPDPTGWMKVRLSRRLDQRMFVAKVVGSSMQPGIPGESWGVFRKYQAKPAATALEG